MEVPLYPPSEWFTPPESMPKDAGCIVEDNGRIFGYLCHWGAVLHDGSGDRWSPPRSRAGYSFAHTGDTKLEDGSLIKTANLGGDAGHAPMGDVAEAQKFYEDTSTQLARVRFGEDEHGVWFAGAVWPSVSELDVARLRASARSGHWAAIGDWRDIRSGKAGYELVGACLVNVPGLKYARVDKAASGYLSFSPLASSVEEVDIMKEMGTRKVDRIASSGTVVFQTEQDSVPVSGILVVENKVTEDGRLIAEGATEWRELPLPLYAKLENTAGHDDAVLIGRIDEIWRNESDPKIIEYAGLAFPESGKDYGQQVIDAVANKTLRGVSIDGSCGESDVTYDDNDVMIMNRIIILGATLTAMPAISEATVTLGKNQTEEFAMDEEQVEDQVEEAAADDSAEEDRHDAVADQVSALSERLEYAISLIEASELNARYEAANRRAEQL